jgi:hypothetical protein
MTPMNLPDDLAAFLEAGRQLSYDADACEAGMITLKPLAELKLELFPIDPTRESDDPREGRGGSYLVPVVDLVASCTGGYEATGLLLWLPAERCFGSWDPEHGYIYVLPQWVGWKDIADAPVQHLNSAWADPDAVPSEELVPYPRYQYSEESYDKPQPSRD